MLGLQIDCPIIVPPIVYKSVWPVILLYPNPGNLRKNPGPILFLPSGQPDPRIAISYQPILSFQ